MIRERDLDLGGGRGLHVYDTRPEGGGLAVFWHHGTPNTGAPPEPLFPASERLGVRWVSHDRPGYGPSTPRPGRDVASAAADVRLIADALGIERFAVMGHSGGGPHALACAALLPDRVLAVAALAGQAPFDAEGLDWLAGRAPSGVALMRAAAAGRQALEQHLAASEFDPEEFTSADHAALDGAWSWLGGIAGRAIAGGPEGMIEDELAYVAAWGFDPAAVRAPTLLVHGGRDRVVAPAHAEWLSHRIPSSELWRRPDDGHISVLSAAEPALTWLTERAR